jgi:hypothetical protein
MFATQANAQTLSEHEKGELLGMLGYGALVLDAYYEICLAKGVRTDNHLNGIDKLAKKKWGTTYTAVSKQSEEESGRNYRQEAHTQIKTVAKNKGGCETAEMKRWVGFLRSKHTKNLERFHSSK